tara:strand:- start:6254 stop:7903 length:1650 start_codon:yes stop_codon:yes gene_type:complete
MKRRKFIKLTSTASAAGLLPMQLNASFKFLNSITNCDVSNRKIVLVDLAGGNDGLNTLIPLNVYSDYVNMRPTTHVASAAALNLNLIDSSLQGTNQDLALHPIMTGMFNLFDQDQLRILQSVGYDSINKSHFASIDIYNTGNDGNNWNNGNNSGWMGRFMENHYSDLMPVNYPMGIQIGSPNTSLGFHGVNEHGLAMNLTGQDSDNFYSVLSGLSGEYPTDFPDSHYGTELQYIVDTDASSNVYAQAISSSFNDGSNFSGANYPDTDLADQLKTVARLMRGGIETKIYLVKLGGFDTHANQVQGAGDLQGRHYNLLDELSTAVEAFMRDLNSDSLAEDVVGITISEFGRKAKENGSLGTDHGKVAPVFIFGQPVQSGISGVNVDLNEATEDNDFQIDTVQFDYRQSLATLMQDFLGSDSNTINSTFMDNITNASFADQKIQNLLKAGYVVPESCYAESLGIQNLDSDEWMVYPNPFKNHFNIKGLSTSPNLSTSFVLVNQFGQRIQGGYLKFIDGNARVDLPNLNTGIYILTLKNSFKTQSFKLIGGSF